ncbi:YdiU family protein [Acetobacter lambici]|uniref:Protein nucleotidyltransferase YdiU n=1 Tax=Acetobacter lambici TaxID=1332824 RepID=A0ABT1EZP2_9PROT|nr:YdiU family protein [Acetobacter lambici]MCP1242194.1 YdiU family protein [Acetobacter lambici]MCP1258211.1 YdiU family protein [Acetobacter lambici]NHO56768.1 YdiU family protein [Acetobacter lambici]
MPHSSIRQGYATLPPRFYARTQPTPVATPRLIALNRPLAAELGLDVGWLAGPQGLAMLAGNQVPQGMDPLATVYAGHQFGHFSPQLGDGRALLLGDVTDQHGQVHEIQLKGSGPTPYSRSGDGRAALGPVLREYLLSESMAALGIATTRALAAVETGERVYRETPLPGAIVARVARSHIRVGTFQFFAAGQDEAALRALADFAIARLYPQAAVAEQPYVALLQGVVAAQAALVARWMLVGFIHGVMNTDNMAISGETIDYGPCAFMDTYNPATVFSFIDKRGRYAYTNQPTIALWNLTRLAEALLPLLAEEDDQAIAIAQQVLAEFHPHFHTTYFAGMRAKLGLVGEDDADEALFKSLLDQMEAEKLDMTNTFRALSHAGVVRGDVPPTGLPASFGPWLAQWRARVVQQGGADHVARAHAMQQVNPCYIPRNHKVEAMIQAAIKRQDYALFEEMLRVLATPYVEQPDMEDYATPPQPDEVVPYTYCGT